LLKRFPSVSAVFWNWRVHENGLSHLEGRENDAINPAIAKCLATFTEAYYRENVGKSSFFTGSLVGNLVYSFRHIQIPRLFDRSKIPRERTVGKNGYFHLLRALATISRDFAMMVTAQLSKDTRGYIWQLPIWTQKAAALMVLKALARCDQGRAVRVILLELEKLASRPRVPFLAVNPLCEFIASIFNVDIVDRVAKIADGILENADDPRVVSGGVRKMLVALATDGAGDRAMWGRKVVAFVAETARKKEIAVVRNEMAMLMSFVDVLVEKFPIELPKLGLALEDAEGMGEKMQGLTIENGKDAVELFRTLV
jgi:hypothetical protein